MTKNEVADIYRKLDPTNKEQFKEYLTVLIEYHATRGRHTQARELRDSIPPLVRKHFTPEGWKVMESMSEEPDTNTGSVGEARAEADMAIQNATDFAANAYYKDRLVSFTRLSKTLFAIIDPKTNNATAVVQDRRDLHYTLFREFLKDTEENPIECGEGSAYRVANDKNKESAIHYVLARVPCVERIPPYSLDNSEVAYHHPVYLPDPTVRCPMILNWFSRLSDGAALMAWIYGTCFNEYKGRQVPYIRGNSETQKSKVLISIQVALFGNAYAGISAKNLKGANQFFMSGLERSKLAAIPDNQNAYIFEEEWLKEISTGDPVRIEVKGDPTIRTEILDVGIMIVSNKHPYFSSAGYARSRAMLIEVPDYKDGKPPWVTEEDIIRELPGFLSACKECWEALKDNNGYTIQINAATEQLVKEATERFEGQWIDLLTKNFIVDADARTAGKEIRAVLRTALKSRSDYVFENFENFLINRGVGRQVVIDGEEYIEGIRIKGEGENLVTKNLPKKEDVSDGGKGRAELLKELLQNP